MPKNEFFSSVHSKVEDQTGRRRERQSWKQYLTANTVLKIQTTSSIFCKKASILPEIPICTKGNQSFSRRIRALVDKIFRTNTFYNSCSYAKRYTSVMTTPKRPGAHIWPTRCWQIYLPVKCWFHRWLCMGSHTAPADHLILHLQIYAPVEWQFHRFLLWQLIFHSYSENSCLEDQVLADLPPNKWQL